MSASVSTRKEVSVALSVTKMRRDPRPSSSAAFTDGWTRFPASICKETGTYVHGPRTFDGNSKNRGFPIFLSISACYVSSGRITAKNDDRISTRALPPVVGLSVHSGRWRRRAKVRLLPQVVPAARRRVPVEARAGSYLGSLHIPRRLSATFSLHRRRRP